jgi:hypothetical protein
MRKFIPIAVALLATACKVEQTPADNQVAANTVTPTAPVAPAAPAAPASPAAPVAPAAPVPPTPASETSAAAATKVLEEYFAAIATKRYRTAYVMWGGNGDATGMSYQQFADSFAKYRIYDGNFGKPGDIEGAAGSAYIEFPAKVTGVLAKGGGFVLEGPMTLRRVNDVDGSTAEQRRWHIASSGLKPRP